MIQEECEKSHLNEGGKLPVTQGTRWGRLQETRKMPIRERIGKPIIRRMREPSVNERG